MSVLAQLVKFGAENGLELQPLSEDYGDESQPNPNWRRFDDAVKTRQLIYDRSLAAARTMPPLENKQHIMRLRDVDYIDKGEFDIPAQKQAILGNKTLGRRMRGCYPRISFTSFFGSLATRPHFVVNWSPSRHLIVTSPSCVKSSTSA